MNRRSRPRFASSGCFSIPTFLPSSFPASFGLTPPAEQKRPDRRRSSSRNGRLSFSTGERRARRREARSFGPRRASCPLVECVNCKPDGGRGSRRSSRRRGCHVGHPGRSTWRGRRSGLGPTILVAPRAPRGWAPARHLPHASLVGLESKRPASVSRVFRDGERYRPVGFARHVDRTSGRYAIRVADRRRRWPPHSR